MVKRRIVLRGLLNMDPLRTDIIGSYNMIVLLLKQHGRILSLCFQKDGKFWILNLISMHFYRDHTKKKKTRN